MAPHQLAPRPKRPGPDGVAQSMRPRRRSKFPLRAKSSDERALKCGGHLSESTKSTRGPVDFEIGQGSEPPSRNSRAGHGTMGRLLSPSSAPAHRLPCSPRGTRCIPGSPGTVAPVKHSPVACVKARAGENSHRASIVCAHTRLADGRHAIHLRHPHRYHLVKGVAGHDLNRLQRRQVVSSRS